MALLFLSVLVPGCTVVVSGGGTWNPGVGDSVRIDASWTVNDYYPTAALCEAADVAWVELRLFNNASDTSYYLAVDEDCTTQRVVTAPRGRRTALIAGARASADARRA